MDVTHKNTKNYWSKWDRVQKKQNMNNYHYCFHFEPNSWIMKKHQFFHQIARQKDLGHTPYSLFFKKQGSSLLFPPPRGGESGRNIYGWFKQFACISLKAHINIESCSFPVFSLLSLLKLNSSHHLIWKRAL